MVNGSGVPQPNADKQPCVLCAGFGQRVLRANIWWSRALKAGGFEYSCGGKIHVEGDAAENDKQCGPRQREYKRAHGTNAERRQAGWAKVKCTAPPPPPPPPPKPVEEQLAAIGACINKRIGVAPPTPRPMKKKEKSLAERVVGGQAEHSSESDEADSADETVRCNESIAPFLASPLLCREPICLTCRRRPKPIAR